MVARSAGFALFLITAPCWSAGIQKCVSESGIVSYSDKPCPQGTKETSVHITDQGGPSNNSASKLRQSELDVLDSIEARKKIEASERAEADRHRVAEKSSLAEKCADARAESKQYRHRDDMLDSGRLDQDVRNRLRQANQVREIWIDRFCK